MSLRSSNVFESSPIALKRLAHQKTEKLSPSFHFQQPSATLTDVKPTQLLPDSTINSQNEKS